MARPREVSDDAIVQKMEALNVPAVTSQVLSQHLEIGQSATHKRLNQLVEEERVGCLTKPGHGGTQFYWPASEEYPGGRIVKRPDR